MHLQPLADGASLVLSDVPEPVAVQPFRKVQVRSVLNSQHSPTLFHATDRPFPVTPQHTFRIDLLRFTVDETIIGFQLMPVSREAFRVWSRGLLSLGGNDAQQTLVPVLMSQVHLPKLRVDPVAVVKSLFHIHGLDFFAKRRDTHATAPVTSQLIDIHRLWRLRRPIPARVASEPCRCADGQPVHRSITRYQMLFRINEALQQPRFETVSGGKVARYPFRAQAENLAGKILAVHLGPDKKTGHVDHPILKPPASGRIPFNPFVPCPQIQSAGTKTNCSQPPVVRTDQITQLPPNQAAILQRVLR